MPKSRMTETLVGVFVLVGFIQLFYCNVKLLVCEVIYNRWLWWDRSNIEAEWGD